MARSWRTIAVTFTFLLCLTSLASAVQGQEMRQTPKVEMAPQPAPDPEAPRTFSMADLQQIALKNNPTLIQSASQVGIAQGKALQAGLYPNPTIGYTGEQMGTEGTAGELQGGYIQQTIVTAGKLRLSRAKYQQQVVVAELIAMGQQIRVLNGVQTGYYRVLASQRMLRIKQDLFSNAQETLKTYKEMFNTGLANQAEVLLAEIALNKAEIALKAQENHYLAHWQMLTAQLGTPNLPPAYLMDNLGLTDGPLDWESSLQKIISGSPEIQAAQAHVNFDQIMLERERVQPIPNINIQASSGYNYETRNAIANVAVGIQLPIWNRNQGTIQQAEAEINRAQAEVRRVELALRHKLANVFNNYRTAYLTALLYQSSNIPKAWQAYEIMEDMYKKRRIAWPEVLKLQKNLLEVQSEYTQHLLALREAEVAINGYLLVDGISGPPALPSAGHLSATPNPR